MRILMVNPNMTQAMTDNMAAIARGVAGQGAEIVPVTAERGFPYVASRAEAQIAGAIALELIAEHRAGADAVILAAFGDPGLAGARELFDLPVIGMAEAAVMTAAMLGETFSIVTFSPLMARWYSDCVALTGLAARFHGVRAPASKQVDLGEVKAGLRADIVALARTAVEDDGADVVILGGAPLAGLAPEIAAEVSGVVLDPISAATAQALALGALATPLRGRARRPAAKSSVGLAPALSRTIAMDDV